MLVGASIAVAYLLGVHVWPVEFARLTGFLSNAGADALQRFSDLDAAFSGATDPQAQAAAWADLREQAAIVANWGGLKPAAIVLVAVPAGFLAAILGSLVSGQRRQAPSAS
jgi:hypothetical protein